jgi:hypothetical protein
MNLRYINPRREPDHEVIRLLVVVALEVFHRLVRPWL